METVLGSAGGDLIYGTQLVSGGNVGNETVQNGGELDLFAGAATGTTVLDGGTLAISGAATATNTVLSGGGTVELASPNATLAGALTFAGGGNTLDIDAIASAGFGEFAVISGFTSTDKIDVSVVGSGATLSFATSGGNEVVTVSGTGGGETFLFSGTSTYTSSTLSLVTTGATVDLETSVPASQFNFQTYNPSQASTIVPGPLALYTVPVDSLPDADGRGVGRGGQEGGRLRPADAGPAAGQSVHRYRAGGDRPRRPALSDSTATTPSRRCWIPSTARPTPTVYVNVIANYSNLTTAQFFAMMQSQNLLLPLNDGAPQAVNPATGAPIPTSLTGLTADPYRGLEYSILKNKSSKLFPTASNITGAIGASTPGLDKMTGAYTDFLEAAAYRDANGGLGLAYLSPGDIALATQWNLTGTNVTTLPNVAGTVTVAQLPGFILSQNIVNAGGISNATLATGAWTATGGSPGSPPSIWARWRSRSPSARRTSVSSWNWGRTTRTLSPWTGPTPTPAARRSSRGA